MLDNLQPERDFVERCPRRRRRGGREFADAVPRDRLRELNAAILSPWRVRGPPQLGGRARSARQCCAARRAQRGLVHGGDLAFASILADGTSIRSLRGRRRGTFSHRHAVLHDVNTGASTSAAAIRRRRRLRSPNSPSRERVLGFEYGYNGSAVAPGHLGSAVRRLRQRRAVIIDEFIMSARVKWASTRSSCCCCRTRTRAGARPRERAPGAVLKMAADTNARIANCTTAAQYFHLLRRQAASSHRSAPPSSAREEPAAPSARGLARASGEGRFRTVMATTRRAGARGRCARDPCSARSTWDWREAIARGRARDPICRVEQCIPCRRRALRAALDGYPGPTRSSGCRKPVNSARGTSCARTWRSGLADARPRDGAPRSASPRGIARPPRAPAATLIDAAFERSASSAARAEPGTKPRPSRWRDIGSVRLVVGRVSDAPA